MKFRMRSQFHTKKRTNTTVRMKVCDSPKLRAEPLSCFLVWITGLDRSGCPWGGVVWKGLCTKVPQLIRLGGTFLPTWIGQPNEFRYCAFQRVGRGEASLHEHTHSCVADFESREHSASSHSLSSRVRNHIFSND